MSDTVQKFNVSPIFLSELVIKKLPGLPRQEEGYGSQPRCQKTANTGCTGPAF